MIEQSKPQNWLAGMPGYRLSFADRCIPSVLLGCADAAREVLFGPTDASAFQQRFEEEYVAVLEALLDGGMPFRVLNLNVPSTPLAERLRDEGYPSFRINTEPIGSSFLYPRDLMVYLQRHNVALVSEHWLRPGAGDHGGVACWPSAWCEGGRVVMRGDTLVLFRHPEKTGAPEQATLNRLRDFGLRIVEIPAGIFASLDGDGHVTGVFYDHHVDRAAGLVEARDGTLHLLLGPGYRTGPIQEPWSADASTDVVRRICDDAEISLHLLPSKSPPYASSLIQSLEGVVVTGSTEPAIRELLGTLVGDDNVVSTAVPLTHFPVFASAGLHCLVTESPEFLLAPPPAKPGAK